MTAKREPGAVGSRVASPAAAAVVAATPDTKAPAGESEGVMDVDTTTTATTITASPQKEEVWIVFPMNTTLFPNLFFQSPWVPELAALFDDIKAIAPGNAYDVIGSVYCVFLE